MFYLIGGTPRAGKTTIAKQLSKVLGIPWISTDTLESVASEYIPEETFAQLFPKSIMRRETGQSNDAMYTQYSADEIKSAYFKQADGLRDALVTFIECESQYGHEYILEGYHITPGLVLELSGKYPVRSVFVGREDLVATLKAITESTQKNDWVISKTESEETFSKIAEMLVAFSRSTKIETEKRGLQYAAMDGDFIGNVGKAVQYLKQADALANEAMDRGV